MNALPRCFLCALTAQTLLFGVCATRPALAERLNLNVWKIPEMERQMAQCQRDMDRTEVTLSEVQARTERRASIADAVAEGRMGLLEAAGHFRELNAITAAGTVNLSDTYQGDSEEERCCRQVIAWVTSRQEQKSPTEAKKAAARLQEELRQHVSPETKLRLSQ